MPRTELTHIDLPEFGLPTVQPTISAEIYQDRLSRALALARASGYDALVVYGDREHMANLAYLSGYDPRFEESLLILAPGREPTLLVGHEGWGYSSLSPAPIRRVLFPTFSLMALPRNDHQSLEDIFRGEGIAQGSRVGLVGWKYFDASDDAQGASWIEVPSFVVDTLRRIVGDANKVVNATALLMNPADGMRILNEVDQLAAFEFASTWSSQSVRNVMFGVKPGMTEFDAARLTETTGLPSLVYTNISSGPRASLGLPSPSLRVIERGDFFFYAQSLWGSLNARAGWMVESADELPEGVRDYVDKLIAPYFAAVADWYAHVGIGVTGGELNAVVKQHIGDPFFGVNFPPGHYIHLDEWVHSPATPGSTIPLQSGMALQVDIIPATRGPYQTTNVEDGIALADEALRAELERRYPEAWGRIQARRRFMESSLGIKLKPEVLPFSNIPAYLPPYLLRPDLAMRVTG